MIFKNGIYHDTATYTDDVAIADERALVDNPAPANSGYDTCPANFNTNKFVTNPIPADRFRLAIFHEGGGDINYTGPANIVAMDDLGQDSNIHIAWRITPAIPGMTEERKTDGRNVVTVRFPQNAPITAGTYVIRAIARQAGSNEKLIKEFSIDIQDRAYPAPNDGPADNYYYQGTTVYDSNGASVPNATVRFISDTDGTGLMDGTTSMSPWTAAQAQSNAQSLLDTNKTASDSDGLKRPVVFVLKNGENFAAGSKVWHYQGSRLAPLVTTSNKDGTKAIITAGQSFANVRYTNITHVTIATYLKIYQYSSLPVHRSRPVPSNWARFVVEQVKIYKCAVRGNLVIPNEFGSAGQGCQSPRSNMHWANGPATTTELDGLLGRDHLKGILGACRDIWVEDNYFDYTLGDDGLQLHIDYGLHFNRNIGIFTDEELLDFPCGSDFEITDNVSFGSFSSQNYKAHGQAGLIMNGVIRGNHWYGSKGAVGMGALNNIACDILDNVCVNSYAMTVQSKNLRIFGEVTSVDNYAAGSTTGDFPATGDPNVAYVIADGQEYQWVVNSYIAIKGNFYGFSAGNLIKNNIFCGSLDFFGYQEEHYIDCTNWNRFDGNKWCKFGLNNLIRFRPYYDDTTKDDAGAQSFTDGSWAGGSPYVGSDWSARNVFDEQYDPDPLTFLNSISTHMTFGAIPTGVRNDSLEEAYLFYNETVEATLESKALAGTLVQATWVPL